MLREEVVAIDPEARTATTESGVHEADALVVALGADYDMDATPGLAEAGEFYSVPGAERMAGPIAEFSQGRAVIGVCDAPFKCPPAPSEAALLLHEHLTERGVRGDCEIAFALPLPTPVPPSPETSAALLAAFEEREIDFVPGVRVASVDTASRVAVLDNGEELPYDLFLGVPKHRAPDVVIESGMTVDDYVPVDSRTLQTRWPGVYAVGDVATVGVPKAGVFAEGAARTVAARADRQGARRGGAPTATTASAPATSSSAPAGSARSTSTSSPAQSRPAPSTSPPPTLVAEKEHFGSSRRARWFGRD